MKTIAKFKKNSCTLQKNANNSQTRKKKRLGACAKMSLMA